MAGDRPVPWERCSHDGCVGFRLPAAAWCLAHVAEQDPSALDAELERIGGEGTIDARGVQLSADLLERILSAAPQEDDRPSFKGEALFHGATFEGAWFGGVTFKGVAGFDRATFKRAARFDRTTFESYAGFDEATFKVNAGFGGVTFKRAAGFDKATFKGDAGFDKATFEGAARFGGATFKGDARFGGVIFKSAVFLGATFKGDAGFGKVTFRGNARFGGASFEGVAGFDKATFEGVAGLDKATFGGAAGFNEATFKGSAWFGGRSSSAPPGSTRRPSRAAPGSTEPPSRASPGFNEATFEDVVGFNEATFKGVARFDRTTFEQARGVGPLLAKQLVLDEAVFRERVQLDVAAAVLSAQRAQFPAGAQFRLRWASVVLDDANLAAPAILAAAEPFPELGDAEQNAVRGWELPPGPLAQQGRPRLLSLCRADVAGLRVANVDLQACRFVGAHNLDWLRIEGEPLFARAPGWWRTRRLTLAEEQHWRAGRPGRWRQRHGWYPEACQPPASPGVQPPAILTPVQVAALYRELRKGREDAKDEPGAADFYYGEMEMRRHAQHEQARPERRRGHWDTWAAARIEHAVVWLYWLLSGYALRAWRALAALTVVVLVAAVAFAFWGFPASAPSFRPVGVGSGGVLIYEQRPAEPPPGVGRLPAAVRFSARSATALLRGPDRALTPLGEWLEIVLRFLGPVLLGLAVVSVRGRVRR